MVTLSRLQYALQSPAIPLLLLAPSTAPVGLDGDAPHQLGQVESFPGYFALHCLHTGEPCSCSVAFDVTVFAA